MTATQARPDGPTGLLNPLEDLLGYQLRRASLVMMADLGSILSDVGLTPTEASILMLILANPGCTQSDLGRALGIKRANMVPLMAGLLKRGAIERSPVDGRSHALTVSEEGRVLAGKVRSRMDRHEQHFQGQLDGKALTAMIDGLKVLRAAMPDEG